jgi:hypothetical protein
MYELPKVCFQLSISSLPSLTCMIERDGVPGRETRVRAIEGPVPSSLGARRRHFRRFEK